MSDIAFIDLKAQQARLGHRLEEAIARVLRHGQYIMGPEVRMLEEALAKFCGAQHALTCSSGTDALMLPLMAWGIGRGDAVIVPTFTFIATAEAPALLGATPIFVDVLPDTFNINPAAIAPAVEEARRRGLRPRAVIAVDLFGQPADYPSLQDGARAHGLKLLADAAQSFGAGLGDTMVGCFADATATSFFPAKPLGCYGDGGAVFTDDAELVSVMESLRVHGHGGDKYDNVRVGLNARLDTLQAAVLLEKLAIFPEELEARRRVAARYTEALIGTVCTPHLFDDARSSWAQYTILPQDRAVIAESCKRAGVPTAIYYPIPMHKQSGYAHHPVVPNGCTEAEDLAARVISLPMHPYLNDTDQDRVIAAVKAGNP